VRAGERGDKPPEDLGRDPVAPILPGDLPEGFRPWNFFFIIMSSSEIPAFGWLQGCPKFSRQKCEIQTIEQGNFITSGPENGPQVKKSERFHPEVVRGEVMDPWVDE
jgi:hypothetical protein